MEKMQEKITVGQLKPGDVIGIKSSTAWEWGATIGEVTERSGRRLRVKDTNGYDLGSTINHKRDAEVWVERDAPADKIKAMIDIVASYAPDQEAEDKLAVIVGDIITHSQSTDTALLRLAHLLTDGLAYGNWPWNLTDAECMIRP